MNLSLAQIICVIAIFQLVVFVISLLSKKFNRLPNRLLASFLILQAIICFNYLVKTLFVYQSEYTFIFLLIGDPAFWIVSPLLYFYVRSLCFSDFKLHLKDTLHVIPAFLIFLMVLLSFLTAEGKPLNETNYFQGKIGEINRQFYFSFVMYIQFLVYNILSLKVIYEYREKLKSQVSSTHHIYLTWLKFVIVGFMFAWIVNLGISLLFFFKISIDYNLAAISFAAFLIFFNVLFFKGWTQSDLFSGIEETKKHQSSSLEQIEVERLLNVIYNYVENEKPFLDPELSLKKLSDSVNIPTRQLSQLINDQIGSNFYDFINGYRIEMAKKLLIISEREKTVSEILYESGFNTKSSFNLAFKKETGLTPTEFRNKNRLL